MYWSHFDQETNRALLKNADFLIEWEEKDGPAEDRHYVVRGKKRD